ncbi:ACT domain-containing protein [Abyssisolibacter fermentans]|uniref:ACT domain-containing protein n=1 Tax=Abyssisolibacter fermentans TaxID=1766203 RepID=UPI00082C51DA|nr:ACT domain-containing protein [Abyssisolibacter fermentans]
MKAIVTVIGKDNVGIISKTSKLLAEHNINILDISQTILKDYFTMIMIVDLEKMDVDFQEISEILKNNQSSIGVTIKIQREDLFNSMHKIS